MEAGGYYEGMGEDAKSKQLSKMISKLCPGCSAPIEKNEGCLQYVCVINVCNSQASLQYEV